MSERFWKDQLSLVCAHNCCNPNLRPKILRLDILEDLGETAALHCTLHCMPVKRAFVEIRTGVVIGATPIHADNERSLFYYIFKFGIASTDHPHPFCFLVGSA